MPQKQKRAFEALKQKYGNIKTVIGGIEFDSKKEAQRWLVLRDMLYKGKIEDLQRQVKYQLIPAQRIDGKVVERACCYIADFVYVRDGQVVVEDTKGVRTKDYLIKRKLMLYTYGIRISEV